MFGDFAKPSFFSAFEKKRENGCTAMISRRLWKSSHCGALCQY
jgi:hypothetical protein